MDGSLNGGDGPATWAHIYAYAVAVDPAGNLYIGNTSNNRIRAVNMGAGSLTVRGIWIPAGVTSRPVAGNGKLEGYSGNGVRRAARNSFTRITWRWTATGTFISVTHPTGINTHYEHRNKCRLPSGDDRDPAREYHNGRR